MRSPARGRSRRCPPTSQEPATALNAHDGAVVRPAGCSWPNYEGETAIVIGRTCRNGAVRQDGSAEEMQRDMGCLVADLARTITRPSR